MTEPSADEALLHEILNREVPRELVEDLFDAEDGENINGWVRVTAQEGDSGRWSQHHVLVVQGKFGSLWGIDYALGLTENQGHDFPWRPDYETPPETLTLRRMKAVPVTTVHYQYMK